MGGGDSTKKFCLNFNCLYIMSIFEKQGMGNPAIPQHPPTITTHNCKMIHCILMPTYTRDAVMQLNIEKTTSDWTVYLIIKKQIVRHNCTCEKSVSKHYTVWLVINSPNYRSHVPTLTVFKISYKTINNLSYKTNNNFKLAGTYVYKQMSLESKHRLYNYEFSLSLHWEIHIQDNTQLHTTH